MRIVLCPGIYVDHYDLYSHDPFFFAPRHRCVIIHEVDVSKDRFFTI